MLFEEALKELRLVRAIKIMRSAWPDDQFLFLLNNELVMSSWYKTTTLQFTQDILQDDWEIF